VKAPSSDRTPAPMRCSERRALGRKAQEALRNGHRSGADSTRSGAEWSAIVGMVNAGWRDAEIVEALLDRVNRGGAKVQELAERRGIPAAHQRITREITKARNWLDAHPPVLDRNGAIAFAAEWRTGAPSCAWTGQSGATDSAVVAAIAALAIRAGRVAELGLAVRDVAEYAGIDKATASRSLHRLEARAWLRRDSTGGSRTLARFTLLIPKPSDLQQSPHSRYLRSDCCTRDGVAPTTGDLWRACGLGKTKARVYGALDDQPVCTAELAELLGVQPDTVGRHLRILEYNQLAEKTETGLLDVVAFEAAYPEIRQLRADAEERATR
jgi:DNA-binding MarR family transcriptional regulator